MKKINGKLCRHCLNERFGANLNARDCAHVVHRCNACGGQYSYYTVTSVNLIGKLKLIGKTA